MNRIIRQPLPWTILAGSSYVLPSRGAARWRLAGVCVSVPSVPAASWAGCIEVQDGGGNVCARFEGGISDAASGLSVTWAPNARTDTITAPAMVIANALAYLPPDCWVEPWHRVFLRSEADLAGATVVVTCELEGED